MPAATQPLAVIEFFLSLQGEGVHAGEVCAFVRLAGCNLACVWCDTTYSWKAGEMLPPERLGVAEVLARVAALGAPRVEVTGGEPLLQRGTPALLAALCDAGYAVTVNTSGSLSIAGLDPRVGVSLDLKCPGSGMHEQMDWTNIGRLRAAHDEVKFVVADRADYEWARTVIAEHALTQRCPVTLSPVMPSGILDQLDDWPLAAQVAGWLIEDRLPARLGLQLHRLLWPRAVRGSEENRPAAVVG